MSKNRRRLFKTLISEKRRLFFFLLFFGIGFYALIGFVPHKEGSYRVQGYIEGKFVHVAPAIAGNIEKIFVREGDVVEKDQALFTLECQREIAARDGAVAQLEHSKEVLENLTKSKRPEEIEAIEASIEQARAVSNRNDLLLERQEALLRTHTVSQQSYDNALASAQSAKARVEELEANLKVAKLPAREDEIHAAEADVRSNEANLRQLQWVVDQKKIVSQVSGIVHERVYEEGDWARSGDPVLTLLPLETMKIRFFVPQKSLVKLTSGMKIKFYVDGLQEPLEGAITFISTEAQYNPPMIYSQDMRSKFVYLIEATTENADKRILHPGQPVDVELVL